MLQKIKQWLKKKLFAKEELEYEAKALALSAMKDSISIVTLAREQLKGFDPHLIDLDKVRYRNSLGLFDGMTDEEQEVLINNIHQLYKNPALKVLLDYLTRNQVLFGQMDADSILQLNFSRGTVNGFSLLQEKINEVEGIYLAKNGTPEEINKFDLIP